MGDVIKPGFHCYSSPGGPGTMEVTQLKVPGPQLSFPWSSSSRWGVSNITTSSCVPILFYIRQYLHFLNSIVRIESVHVYKTPSSEQYNHALPQSSYDNLHTRQAPSSWAIFLTKLQTFIPQLPQRAAFLELKRTCSVRFYLKKLLWLVWSPQTTKILSM